MTQELYENMSHANALHKICEKIHPHRVLVVGSKRAVKNSRILSALEGKEVECFSNFSQNPELTKIITGISTWEKFKPDLVIAIGGGTALDVAKSINILAIQEGDVQNIITNKKTLKNSDIPLVAIPTTAGSGSEATHFAVVYIDGEKYSLTHSSMLPSYVILDVSLLDGISSQQAAYSGIDALCQAIESMWAVNANEESKRYSSEAIILIRESILGAVKGGSSESKTKMMRAAYLAGKAINISKTTASHAMSYALTKKFGVVHGQAVSVTLPELFIYNSNVSNTDVNHPGGVNGVNEIITELCNLFEVDTPEEFTSVFHTLMQSISLSTQLRSLGIPEESIPDLANSVSIERASNNPRHFTPDTAECILRKVF